MGLGDITVISYFGTYWHVEGLKVLLEAVSQLVKSGERFRLLISGVAHQGLDCDDVSDLIQRFRLHDVAIETGWLSTSDVVAGMSAADILVIPKLNDIANAAGMPAKLAEYLAMGRAVVASRVGEIPLYVTDREDVFLCEPGSPDSLAEALREVICNIPLRNKLASNSRYTSKKNFSHSQVVSRLAAKLTELSE